MQWKPLFAALVLAGASLPGSTVAADAPGAGGPVVTSGDRIAVRHETLRLANGFEVILVEDHRLPLVAFNLWVHAGPRNEARGQTGFAHLFEHLMFAGSKHIARGQADKIIDAAGGTDSNGSTNFDRTNYYFTLPANQLELGLWIKSDMLGYMIDQVDAVALANQQDVVRNERRQTTESRPYGIVEEAMYEALFPQGHPYRAVVIGSHADIQSIKLADVKAFAKTYYRPNNATLVLAGDFRSADAKRLVQKYFGSLKAGRPVPPVAAVQPRISVERRLVVADQVELPRLTMAWHTPAHYRPGDAELDVVANLLGGGKSSRLYKRLVYELQVAQSVTALQDSMSLGSVFSIEVVARPGQSLDGIERAVDQELAQLTREGPTEDELKRARAAFETQLFGRLEKVGTLADLLNHYRLMAGDADFIGKDLDRYRQLTLDGVRATAAEYLRQTARVVVHAMPGAQVLAPEVPTPPSPLATKASERESLNADEPWRRRQPAARALPAMKLPLANRFTLANGLTVVHSPKPGVPLVSAELVLRAGQSANPATHAGLAGFTAAMLQEGTQTRSALAVAAQTADLGASLVSLSGREETRVELGSLKSAFAPALALLADVVLNPAFDAAEIERVKKTRLAALLQQRENAAQLASLVANQAFFGDAHPLGASGLGTEQSIQATDRAALLAFWQQHYRPDQAALVVAGDVTESELRVLAERLFGGWKRPESGLARAKTLPARSTDAKVVLVDKPGAPQTALVVLGRGPLAGGRDAQALEVMNAALGGLFTSRINTQLREVKGYTYGVSSGYVQGRESGLFGLHGSVRSEVTGAALVEVFKEFNATRARPMGQTELQRVRNALLLSLPGQFDTNQVIADGYARVWLLGLPDDHIARLPGALSAVTANSAWKAARDHLDPRQLIVVAVGDKAKVAPQIAAWGRKPVLHWAAPGNKRDD
ncbi:M16 family metallopeptidase [Rhodoferax sp.]|uniref:M16 family metallopeptidase n=1 Tax=Rhodoferax sp. TaxID=50421 RepID=UPI002769FFFA|nr:pitrilysin family protein [Rhodoferax sp.]